MNDSRENHSTGSYVEPRVPSITGFGQRKINGKPKIVLNYSLEKCNDNSGTPKIDVCLRLKPRTYSIPSNEVSIRYNSLFNIYTVCGANWNPMSMLAMRKA